MFFKNIFKILLLGLALAHVSWVKKKQQQQKFPISNSNFKPEQKNSHFQLSNASSEYIKCRFPDSYVLRQPSENDKKLPATLQLEKFIVDATANLLFKLNEVVTNTANAVIRDLEALPNGNHTVQQFRNEILENERTLPLCKTFFSMQVGMGVYDKVIDSYYGQPENVKADAYNLTKNFEKETNNFNTQFEEKYEELKEAIERENKLLSEELNKWYKETYEVVGLAYGKSRAVLLLILDEWFAEHDDKQVDRSAINYDLF